MKSYMDCLDEITATELYEGLLGYGLFAEKLPPIFSSLQFLEYCKTSGTRFCENKKYKYVYYESIRNTNIPRPLGIPTPMSYEILCRELRDNWNEIRDVFRSNTGEDPYKVSRIHIRKRLADKVLLEMKYEDIEEKDTYDDVTTSIESTDIEEALFNMNYKNWRIDGNPVIDFSIGKKYIVRADIAQCFPSVYTHAISWALVGKVTAKGERNNRKWFNKIDRCCRNMRDGETQGILIGPHSSNLIAEILLTRIDKELRAKKYDYIRNIDDYTCYTETYEMAERFLIDLNEELHKYGFNINHKKTTIENLPQASSEFWVQKLQDKPLKVKYDVVDYNSARSYLDKAILLMKNNGNNASSICFAIKAISKNECSKSAKDYCIKIMCNLAIIYPYLVPIMDTFVFEAFNATSTEIEKFSIILYLESMKKRNYEGVSFALFYASKYGFILPIDIDDILGSNDCICKVSMLRYCRIKGDSANEELLINDALSLISNEFDENWIFVYEALCDSDLQGEWLEMKKRGVSFLL